MFSVYTRKGNSAILVLAVIIVLIGVAFGGKFFMSAVQDSLNHQQIHNTYSIYRGMDSQLDGFWFYVKGYWNHPVLTIDEAKAYIDEIIVNSPKAVLAFEVGDKTTNKGVEGVYVSLYRKGSGSLSYNQKTNERGVVKFLDLPLGNYNWKVISSSINVESTSPKEVSEEGKVHWVFVSIRSEPKPSPSPSPSPPPDEEEDVEPPLTDSDPVVNQEGEEIPETEAKVVNYTPEEWEAPWNGGDKQLEARPKIDQKVYIILVAFVLLVAIAVFFLFGFSLKP